MNSISDPLPWKDWAEWRRLRDDLWSPQNERVTQALAKIRDWGLVGRVPIEVEVTAALFRARSLGQAADPEILQALHMVPVVRLSAALRDQKEKLTLRPESELPFSVTLARNSYAHGEKPTIEHLKCVCETAMRFIKENYWDFIEESLCSEELLVKVTERFLNLRQEIGQEVLKEIRACLHLPGIMATEQSETERDLALRTILSALDGHQLHSFLLDHLSPPPSKSAHAAVVEGLVELCDCYGASWLVYFAELWLERAICLIQRIDEEPFQKSSASLAAWGEILGSALPSQPTVVHSSELERLLHKTTDLVQQVTSHDSQQSERKASLPSFLETAEKIFSWSLEQVKRKETKEQLLAVFQMMKRQVKDPDHDTPSAAGTSVQQNSDTKCGLFTKLESWESCAIGSLPYNH